MHHEEHFIFVFFIKQTVRTSVELNIGLEFLQKLDDSTFLCFGN